MALFCRQRNLELRFIEFMPLDGDEQWQTPNVLQGEEIRDIIESEIGPLGLKESDYKAQPAKDFEYRDGSGSVGFIDPVSSPFCTQCDRLRLTAEGKLRNCLPNLNRSSVAVWRPKKRGTGSTPANSNGLNEPCIRSAAKMALSNMQQPSQIK